jgi:hypothetical protein
MYKGKMASHRTTDASAKVPVKRRILGSVMNILLEAPYVVPPNYLLYGIFPYNYLL